MRSHDSLTRLAAVAPAVPVDAVEEDRILERILASPRPAVRRRPMVVVLVGAAVLIAAAAAATLVVTGRGAATTKGTGGHHHVALSGSRIRLAGYHFRTPAGFTATAGACGPSTTYSFAAAASADGGCVEAFFMIASPGASSPADNGAQPVDVGSYQGYFVPTDASGQSTLYVQLPTFYNGEKQYLALFSEGLTEEQLIAVAQSGLPGNG